MRYSPEHLIGGSICMCTFEIMCTLLCTDCTVYGTVSAVSALAMSAVVGAICTAVYIRCKHKGNVYILALKTSKWCEFLTR